MTRMLPKSMPYMSRDANELRSVINAQNAEAELLKTRLANQQREVVHLQQRLRDAEGELSVAADATTSATERLGSHAERQGLVLASAVERSGVERSTVEMELQRTEAELHARDNEIRRLRKQAHELEAVLHSNDMEIKGLQHSHESNAQRARAAAERVANAMGQLQGLQGQAGMPSEDEKRQLERVEALLQERKQQLAVMQQRADNAAAEAKHAEDAHMELNDRLNKYQATLQAKKEEMGSHDQRYNNEVQLLHDHCEQLRQTLHQEQREAVGVDQRAVLHQQCSAEADSVRLEQEALLGKLPRLAASLKERGQAIRSPQTIEDPLDMKVHRSLQAMDENGIQTPSILWRLSAGDYIVGSQQVSIFAADAKGDLLRVKTGRGGGNGRELIEAFSQL